MLETLCNSFGVSGFENEVSDIIYKKAQKLCDKIEKDSIGNIICYKKGFENYHNKIMLTAHMDEVGFIVSGVTEEGYLRFKTVGGIDDRILQSQKLIIGKNKINGIIGAKPAHLIKKDDNGVVKSDDLYIDIGAKNAQDAKKYVNLGDYAVFNSIYREFGNNKIKAKALDDRIGCYVLLRLMELQYPNDIYFCFTVQEEVGCRGAKIAAYTVNPDYAIVIEGTTCSDVPGTDETGFSTHMGKGPAISILDGGSYSSKEMIKTMYETAKYNKIKVQFKQTTMGGNDAAVINVTQNGVKTGVLSVPCRYIHSPSSVADKNDIENCFNLLKIILSKEENMPWNS